MSITKLLHALRETVKEPGLMQFVLSEEEAAKLIEESFDEWAKDLL